MKKLLMGLFFVSPCYAMERVSFVSNVPASPQYLAYAPSSPKLLRFDRYTTLPSGVAVAPEEQARAFDHLMELHTAILHEPVPARRAFKIKELSDDLNTMNLQLYSAVVDDPRIPRACRRAMLTRLPLKKDALLDECYDVWDACLAKRAQCVAREKAIAERHAPDQQVCCSIQ
jgi:hypothetical protein